MGKCIREIFYCIHKSNNFLKLISILILICLVGSKSVYSYFMEVDHLEKKYSNTYEGNNYHKLSDNFVGELETYPYQLGVHEKLTEFNHKLNTSNTITYIEQNEQYINLADYRGDEKLLSRYESGDYETDIFTEIDEAGLQTEWHTVKGFYVGVNYFSTFPMECMKGRLFRETDFLFEQGKPVPVILGSDFSQFYQVGDEILVKTPFIKTSIVVVGFLSDTAAKYETGMFKSLNRYVIFPLINLQQLGGESVIDRNILCYMKNTGLIKTSMTKNDTQSYIYQLCEELDLEPVFIIQGATNTQSQNLHVSMKTIIEISFIATLLFAIFVIILILVHMNIKLRNNSYYFSILYLNGFSSREITVIMIGDILFILSLCNIIGEIIYRGIMKALGCSIITVLYNVVISVLIVIIPILITTFKLKHKDLCMHMKEGK